jgi:SAM-dependent methyltransferase
MDLESHNHCPVCGNKLLEQYLDSADFFFTQESFTLNRCAECGLILTNPFPGFEESLKYYQSETYFSHPNKKRNLFGYLYQLVRIQNMRSKIRVVKKFIRSGRILDIGCGSGDFLLACIKNGFDVSGIEVNDDARNFTSARIGSSVYQPKDSMIIPSHHFGMITMWHVLEHIHDLDRQMNDIVRMLEPNGFLLLALPNPESYDCRKYGRHWAAWDLPRHVFHFTPKTIHLLAGKFGLKPIQTFPMKWDAYYISMLSEGYRQSNLGLLRGLFAGLSSNLRAKRTGNYSSLIYVFKKM